VPTVTSVVTFGGIPVSCEGFLNDAAAQALLNEVWLDSANLDEADQVPSFVHN
jgi:hypothetical protein